MNGNSQQPESFDPRYTRRTIKSHNLYSTHLLEERTIKICLPQNFDPGRSYPVVYCQDGNEFFTHGRIATIANQMVGEGEIDPLLIVGIAVNHKRRSDDYAIGGIRSEAYRRFVVEECLPFIENHYPVDADQRFFAGVSLGAAATLSLAMADPDRFNKLLLFSGAYYPAAQTAVKAAQGLFALRCYMLVGRQETALETDTGVYNFYELNQQMRSLFESQGVAVDYEEADGTHIWGFWQSHLPDALRWLQSTVERG